jgi:phage-related baseplate assembly protein
MSEETEGTELPLFSFNSKVVPDIDFCVKDASLVESDVISKYESMFYLITKINKTLGRGDPVRLFLLSIIYQIVVQRSIVDSTGKENLLKYSHGANLDNLGAKWGSRGLRISAQKSTVTLRFSLSAALTIDAIIPFGTLAQSNSGIQFATTVQGTIVAGGLQIDIPAEAVVAGEEANGLVAGQIEQLVQWSAPFLVSVSNVTTSSGGTDIEDDDHLRARIWMAPESLSVAGPREAYEFWAASANPDIMDISAFSDPPNAGKVWIYPLMDGGVLPTQIVLDQVYAICNDKRIRPLTDQVFVEAPTVVVYNPTVRYWIRKNDEPFLADIQAKIQQAYSDYKYWQRTKIGRDVNPSKLDQMLIEAGAKRTDIPDATSTFEYIAIDKRSVAQDNPAATLQYQGLEEE